MIDPGTNDNGSASFASTKKTLFEWLMVDQRLPGRPSFVGL